MKPIHFKSSPVTQMQGTITVPGDKSISHRALLLGAIAEGTTQVVGFLNGEDCRATLRAMRAMGVSITDPDSGKLLIYGVGKQGLTKPADVLDCGNSGTTMRLMAGLLSAQSFDSTLDGDASLRKRPMARITRPLLQMGADIATHEAMAPLRIQGGKTLTGITYIMPQASAQVKSCLLLAGMYAHGNTVITEPAPVRDHTERLLNAFSYPVITHANTISIHSAGVCQATLIDVPGDISSAAFFIVAATLIKGSDLLIKNVGINPTRTGILTILQRMGADIEIIDARTVSNEPRADLRIRHAPLTGVDIPTELVPLAIDEFPIIFIACACAQGISQLRGASELRVKESDRLGVMVENLRRLGIEVESFDDGLRIEGGRFTGGLVDSHQDHRIAMAFTVAGAVASDPVIIKDCLSVATSFPDFLTTASNAGMHVRESCL